MGKVNGVDTNACCRGEVLLRNSHAVVTAKKIARRVVVAFDVADVRVHVLHFKLKTVERF